MKHKLLFAAAALAITGSSLVYATSAQAQTAENPKDTIIQKLTQKFGIQESEVKAVFDEHHKEMQAKRQVKMEEKLTQLMKDGKITEAQKTAIIAKMKEMQSTFEANKEAMKNMTPEQRKAAMETHKKEMEAWAQQNGIDMKTIMPFGMKGHGHFK